MGFKDLGKGRPVERPQQTDERAAAEENYRSKHASKTEKQAGEKQEKQAPRTEPKK